MNRYLGEIALFAFDFTPRGWMPCTGAWLDARARAHMGLYSVLGTRFGGAGTVFRLPAYEALMPPGPAYGIAAGGVPPNRRGNDSPDDGAGRISLFPYDFVPPGWRRCDGGLGTPDLARHAPTGSIFLVVPGGAEEGMDEVVIGEVRLHDAATAHPGWIPCDGRILPADHRYPDDDWRAIRPNNAALFELLGHRFGGSDQQFALPDLRGIALPAGLEYRIAGAGGYPSR